jgi:hypothetical protein
MEDAAELGNRLSRSSKSEKVQAYLEYTRSGKYAERYGTRSLRVLTVTTGEKRLANLKRATEQAGGREMFWFTTVEQVGSGEGLLVAKIWQVAGQEGVSALIGGRALA